MRAAAVVVATAVSATAFAGPTDGGSRDGAQVTGPGVERSLIDISPSPGHSFDTLSIDNSLGDVRVEGHDGKELRILAVKRAPDRDALERLKVSLVPDPAGPVTLTTRLVAGAEARPVAAGSIRVDLIVQAPRSTLVKVRTWNGAVAVTGVDNGVQLSANEGDIEVRSVMGEVSTRNAQGEQHLDDVVGTVSARALYGDVRLDWIRGRRLSAVAHEGSITARRVESRNIELRSLRGDVTLEMSSRSLLAARIAALRGNVRITVPARTPLQIHAASRSGHVTIPASFEPHRRSDGHWEAAFGAVRQGRGRVSIRTGVGDVVFAVAQE